MIGVVFYNGVTHKDILKCQKMTKSDSRVSEMSKSDSRVSEMSKSDSRVSENDKK
jgi:hypothetical protein